MTATIPAAVSAKQKNEETWPFYHWPSSSAYARKRGEFQFAVKAIPASFTWEGHKVVVDDCWKQQCGTVYYLFFKLTVDGTTTGEHRIFKENGLKLAFKHDGDEFPNAEYGIQDYDVVPPRRIPQAFVGIPSTDVVHFVRLEGPDTKEVRLRIGTLKRYKFPNKQLQKHPFEDPNFKKSLEPVMGDTIVNFNVSVDTH